MKSNYSSEAISNQALNNIATFSLRTSPSFNHEPTLAHELHCNVKHINLKISPCENWIRASSLRQAMIIKRRLLSNNLFKLENISPCACQIRFSFWNLFAPVEVLTWITEMRQNLLSIPQIFYTSFIIRCGVSGNENTDNVMKFPKNVDCWLSLLMESSIRNIIQIFYGSSNAVRCCK